MTAQTALRRLSALESAVLETVVYSDIFDFPLTHAEVRQRLTYAASAEEVEAALEDEALSRFVARDGPYVILRGRESIRETRERRRESPALMEAGRKYGRLIAALPLVRMVALTGSLAAENAEPDDDIDYLIVTARGRVWLARTLVMLAVRGAALRGVTLCPNYLVAEDALALPERDLYTARELMQMKLIAGPGAYRRMLEANAWYQNLLPNAEIELPQATRESTSLLRRAAEWLLTRRVFDRVEAWVLARKGAELRRAAGGEAVFDKTMCKGHFEGWRERTQRLVRERVELLLEQSS